MDLKATRLQNLLQRSRAKVLSILEDKGASDAILKAVQELAHAQDSLDLNGTTLELVARAYDILPEETWW